jgi:hypothetical protein
VEPPLQELPRFAGHPLDEEPHFGIQTAGTVVLLYKLAKPIFGLRATGLAGLAYLLSGPMAHQIWLARMDSLLLFTIAAGAAAAWCAWNRGNGWTWFWLAAAAGTLTKGSGLLCAAPMAAALWDRGTVLPRRRPRGHLIGIALFLLVTAGWFFTACHVNIGIYHKLIVDELLSQTVRVNKGHYVGSRFYEAPFYFVARFLPWSVPAIAGVVRLFRFPAADPLERRFERFVACWLLVGMIPFSLNTHQRGELIGPLFAPGALLAGRELARWLNALSSKSLAGFSSLATAVGLFLIFGHYHLTPTLAMEKSEAVASLARQVRTGVGSNFPLTHLDDPLALSIDLNTMRPYYFGPTKFTTGVRDLDLLYTYDLDAGVQLLSGSPAVFVAAKDTPEFRDRLHAAGVNATVVAGVRLSAAEVLSIFSNRPELRQYDDMILGVGPLKLRTQGLHWISAAAGDFAVSGKGELTVTNNLPQPVTIRITHGDRTQTHVALFGEVWSVYYP